MRFKDDIDRPLAAILTLNTIAHTVGAIGVGSQAALIFGESMLEVAGVPVISLEALIAGLMTLAILIFSEVIPKTIGANNWEALAPFTIASLKVMLSSGAAGLDKPVHYPTFEKIRISRYSAAPTFWPWQNWERAACLKKASRQSFTTCFASPRSWSRMS